MNFINRDDDLLFTKITRPGSFWTVLISFIILLFLNSFGIIHTDPMYLEILKQLLQTMTGFYFTSRGIEKIAKIVYENKNKNLDNSNNSNISNVSNISNSSTTTDISEDDLKTF